MANTSELTAENVGQVQYGQCHKIAPEVHQPLAAAEIHFFIEFVKIARVPWKSEPDRAIDQAIERRAI